jgi:hypothetical protein
MKLDPSAPYVVIFKDRRVMPNQLVAGAYLVDALAKINTNTVEFFQRLEGKPEDYRGNPAH